MFDPSPAPFGLVQRVCSAARAESCAAGERLVAIGELFALRRSQSEETTDWAVDAEAAVTAEVAAALGISQGLAGSQVRYARAMREQLPALGRAFVAGDITETTFRTCVFRTGLILDEEVMAKVDARLAVQAPRWGRLNRHQVAARIDRIVADVDRDAVRRRKDRIAGREVVIGDVDRGLAEISGTLLAPDAHALNARLTALAMTVCDADPRSVAERRADACGVLAAGGDRLGCRCGSTGCPAGGRAASPVVIHVVAEAATVDGTGRAPAAMLGFEGLLPPELIAELAKAARVRPLVHPREAPPEPHYVPSRALADLVRCRDLTCRFPGCTVPATRCDVDHVVPRSRGGPTQASNLSCRCRTHHLLKTFWGWRDEQLVDGTLIWTSPVGDRYVTHPGGALLFPGLGSPTVGVRTVERSAPCCDRYVMMPRRRRSRDGDRTAAIVAERRRNQRVRVTPVHDAHALPRPPDPLPPF
ncbi:HNH endonuclease signature motif containing protein [Mycolicibacterium sp. 050158]|uniref:HNH endonuclease signature motif containing protein n=1 Tax=Mycolicibacterium sp. 050158 TaxID=3090602 RepID=UPI00299CECC8|nr:HNH endonuclease signature motif containing protein [Mycolicibacterium sp. 050158]MDX1891279.1 HNH endonuclease signature motif containing protein [Mycolicibacterium sp. 050158]